MRPEDIEITGPIVEKDEAERVAYAAVLVPGEPDSDGDVVSKEKVQEVAWEYLANWRQHDEQHTLKSNIAETVESYVTDAPKTVEISGKSTELPEGTWIVGSRIDAEHWPKVQKGELEGFSIMGVKRADYEAALATANKSEAAEFEVALKRTTLADLGDDWFAPVVSIVKGPAVPKAKWFALKSKEPTVSGGFGAALGRWLQGKTKEQVASEKAGGEVVTEEQVKAIVRAMLAELGLGGKKKPKKPGETEDGKKAPPPFLQKAMEGEELSESEASELFDQLFGDKLEELGITETEEDEDGTTVTKSKTSELEEQNRQLKERLQQLEGSHESAVAELREEFGRRLSRVAGKSKRLDEEDGDRVVNKSEEEHWSDGYEEMGLDSFGRPLKNAG